MTARLQFFFTQAQSANELVIRSEDGFGHVDTSDLLAERNISYLSHFGVKHGANFLKSSLLYRAGCESEETLTSSTLV